MSQSRAFAFTLNYQNHDVNCFNGIGNPVIVHTGGDALEIHHEEFKDKYRRMFDDPSIAIQYLVCGFEQASTGQNHIQGTVYFKVKKSFSFCLKKFAPAHIEICRNVQASIVYCKKDKNFIDFGSPPLDRAESCSAARLSRAEKNKRLLSGSLLSLVEQGILPPNQVPLIKKARQILASELPAYEHDSVRGIWFVGPPGVGKSHEARSLYPIRYDKPQNKWFDGYEGEEVILLDDLDTDALGHHLKIWMDKWACSAETKFGKVNLRHKQFVVTSNYSPEELFKCPIMAQAIRRRCAVYKKFENHAFNGVPGPVHCTADALL